MRVVRDLGPSVSADGRVLVTDMTDPDWEPVMRRVAAIVTDKGGRTARPPSSRANSGCPASSAPKPRPPHCATATT